MEFLGDSVLHFLITKVLYDRYPESNEGFLTRLRTKLVSGETLSGFAQSLGLDRFVLMNQRAYAQNWNSNPRILEDVFEALLGAMYLDRGLPHCRRFVERMLDRHISWEDIIIDNNHKDQLMRVCQHNGWNMPSYEIVTVDGPEHSKLYHIQVHVNERPCVGRGCHTNKRKAEQHAAKEAIEYLKLSVPISAAALE